jgi:hypothetical protein
VYYLTALKLYTIGNRCVGGGGGMWWSDPDRHSGGRILQKAEMNFITKVRRRILTALFHFARRRFVRQERSSSVF